MGIKGEYRITLIIDVIPSLEEVNCAHPHCNSITRGP